MYLIIFILLLTIISYFIFKKLGEQSMYAVLHITISVIFIVCIIGIPISRLSDSDFIVEYNSVKYAIESIEPNNIDPTEKSNIINKTIDYNAKLKVHKNEANNGWISIYSDKEGISNLEYIEMNK